MRPLILLGFVLGCCGALAAGALQQPQERRPLLSVQTNLVMLPVTVLDSRGTFVPRLVLENFTLYDNGVVRPIEFFTSEDLPATVGLVIDSSGSMSVHRDEVTAAGSAFASFSHPLDEMFTVNFNEHVWLGLPPLAVKSSPSGPPRRG